MWYVANGWNTGTTTINSNRTVQSNQANAEFGASVASAGDVNGDGFSDVIVGAYHYDDGQTDEGKVFVYLGSASGLATSPAWTAQGDQANADFGGRVASAGDVNGDGFSDVIVGARRYDAGQTDEGRAFVYLGSASGLSANPSWTAEGDQVEADFARSVATAGDVNGDGFADVIVGADLYDNGSAEEGRAFVYLGSASGLATNAAWTGESDQSSSYFGSSVATAGDVNGDGYSDVLVGAVNYDNGNTDEGRVFLYLGSAAGTSPTAIWTGETDTNLAHFGNALATAGDVNCDGYADVVVAHNSSLASAQGSAYVYYGSPSGLPATYNWTVPGGQTGAQFGGSVASAGDVNGDGCSDVVVGAPGHDNGQTDEGRAYVYRGAPSSFTSTLSVSVDGDQLGSGFGSSVASAGDVNGDGFADLVVGARYYDSAEANVGRVFVYFGSANGPFTSAPWYAESQQAGCSFGVSVSGAGDVNGDGYSDIIVGASNYFYGEVSEGRAFVYLGSASGPGAEPDWTAELNLTGANFGAVVAGAGDVNGDGYGDVVVSSALSDGGGQVDLFLGSGAGLATTPAASIRPAQRTSAFGSTLTNGDFNGDGYSDVVVSAYTYTNGQTQEGRVFVYMGSASGLEVNSPWTAESDQANAWFGQRVVNAGDVNGDGYCDLATGAYGFDTAFVNAGRGYVYLGSATGLPATPSQTFDGTQAGANAGRTVTSLGDVNGDSYGDISISWAGTMLGSPTSLVGTGYGEDLRNAGDLNGDGFSDLFFTTVDATTERVSVSFGNSGDRTPSGSHPHVRALRPGTAIPVPVLGSARGNGFDVRATGRTPFGRGKTRLEVEAKPHGTPFDGTGLAMGAWYDTGLSGNEHLAEVRGLSADARYHFRARFRYQPSLGWPQATSCWSYGGALGEPLGVHLRTSCAGGDSDTDGVPDCADGCPNDQNKTSPGECGCGIADTDADGDGTPNCSDGCDDDPNKTEPGECGCGTADVDSDSDGTLDCDDACPADPAKISAGLCGCGASDADSDTDGTPNCTDGCPSDQNKTSPGACGCGVPEGNCVDGCPNDPQKTAPGLCGCGVADTDDDFDGTPNCTDSCPSDPGKTGPGVCGCGQADADADSDGAPNCSDGCANDATKTAPGLCGCGTPDADSDGDSTLDCRDDCPATPASTANGCPEGGGPNGEGGAGGETPGAGAGGRAGEGGSNAPGGAGSAGRAASGGSAGTPDAEGGEANASGGAAEGGDAGNSESGGSNTTSPGGEAGASSPGGGEAGTSARAGAAGAPQASAPDESGCSCRTAPSNGKSSGFWLTALFGLALALRRRRGVGTLDVLSVQR